VCRNRPADVPIPPAIASRPSDPRGYPVPAITPWENAVPQFASPSMKRVFLCGHPTEMHGLRRGDPAQPLWRVVDSGESEMLAEGLAAGVGASCARIPHHQAGGRVGGTGNAEVVGSQIPCHFLQGSLTPMSCQRSAARIEHEN
jgi:hypothetical protein